MRVAIRSYFRVKANGLGLFKEKYIKEEVIKEISEAAKELNYGVSIVPGEIVVFSQKKQQLILITQSNYMEV